MQGFPANDSYWVSTANFVETHAKAEESLLAPPRFSSRLKNVKPLTPKRRSSGEAQWVILHKGKLDELDLALLSIVEQEFVPVFANEVFVVFTSHRNLPAISRSAPHVLAFYNKLKQSQQRRQRSLKLRIANLEFEATIRSRNALVKESDRSHRPNRQSDRDATVSSPSNSSAASTSSNTAQIKPASVATVAEAGDFDLPAERFSNSPAERGIVYLDDHRVMTRTVWGHKIYLDTRDVSLAPHILMEGRWEHWITKVFLRNIAPDMTVLDVGANVGYYTLLAGSQVKGKGHVYAFEANPAVFENLFRSVGINGLSEEITLVNKAVYKTSTKLKFHVFSQYQGSSTIIDLPSGYAADYGDTTELVEVEAVSLDDYFAEQIPKVDFIKIDAEGSEVFIFEGMEKLINQNPHLKIMFEYNPGFVAASGIKPQEFLEKLVHQGFQLKRVAHDSTLVNASIEELLSTSRQHELMAVR